jgi:hypothetical protein
MLMPVAIAAGFVHAAMTADWIESETWVYGLLLLVPFEFVRALVYSILGDTFRSYESPTQAVRSFLVSMLILLVIGLIFGIYVLGFRDFFAAVTDLGILRIISVPACDPPCDGIIALYFFRGNPRIQAVRIQAAADDLVDWLQLALFPTPFVLALWPLVCTGCVRALHRRSVGYPTSTKIRHAAPRCATPATTSSARRYCWHTCMARASTAAVPACSTRAGFSG